MLCEVECQGHTDMTSHCVIKVKDTGIGMSEEFLKNGVFKAFSQEHSTETVNQGTGLGLSIAKMLVELMGGTIEVESELGSGTEFIVQWILNESRRHRRNKRFMKHRRKVALQWIR